MLPAGVLHTDLLCGYLWTALFSQEVVCPVWFDIETFASLVKDKVVHFIALAAQFAAQNAVVKRMAESITDITQYLP